MTPPGLGPPKLRAREKGGHRISVVRMHKGASEAALALPYETLVAPRVRRRTGRANIDDAISLFVHPPTTCHRGVKAPEATNQNTREADQSEEAESRQVGASQGRVTVRQAARGLRSHLCREYSRQAGPAQACKTKIMAVESIAGRQGRRRRGRHAARVRRWQFG